LRATATRHTAASTGSCGRPQAGSYNGASPRRSALARDRHRARRGKTRMVRAFVGARLRATAT